MLRYTYTHLAIRTDTHFETHTHTHTHIHIHTHKHPYTHTYTHMHVCNLFNHCYCNFVSVRLPVNKFLLHSFYCLFIFFFFLVISPLFLCFFFFTSFFSLPPCFILLLAAVQFVFSLGSWISHVSLARNAAVIIFDKPLHSGPCRHIADGDFSPLKTNKARDWQTDRQMGPKQKCIWIHLLMANECLLFKDELSSYCIKLYATNHPPK